MDPIELGLAGILLPAVIAGLSLALGWRAWRRDSEPSGHAAGAPALALAYLAAHLAVAGPPASPLPGSERTPAGLDWLFWLVALFGLLLTLERPLTRRGPWWSLALRLVAAALLVGGVLRMTFQREWSGWTEVAWLSGLALLLAVPWTVLEREAREHRGARSALVLWATAASLAIVAVLSGSAKLAQLSGAVAAALGAAVVLAWWRPRVSLAGGGVSLAVLTLFGVGLCAHFYSYTTAADALLVAAGPVMPLAMRLPGLRKLRGGRGTAAALALASLPLAVAVLRAVLAYEPDPYAEYYE